MAVSGLLEDVVLRDGIAERQRAALRGHTLDRAPQIDLGGEKVVAPTTVLVGLARETDVMVSRQRI